MWSNARGGADAGAASAMAAWWANDVSRRAVQRALRRRGYGLALEYDIQLYFRRINALALIEGDPVDDLSRAGDRLWSAAAVALPPAGVVDIEIGFGPWPNNSPPRRGSSSKTISPTPCAPKRTIPPTDTIRISIASWPRPASPIRIGRMYGAARNAGLSSYRLWHVCSKSSAGPACPSASPIWARAWR